MARLRTAWSTARAWRQHLHPALHGLSSLRAAAARGANLTQMRGLLLFAVLLVVVSACGSDGDDESTSPLYYQTQADLELVAVATPVVAGRSDLSLEAHVLDRRYAPGARVLFEFGDGVSAPAPLPEDCAAVDAGVECVIGMLQRWEDPVEATLTVEVRVEAEDPSVTMSVTSVNNPVSNDPNPANNVVTVNFT